MIALRRRHGLLAGPALAALAFGALLVSAAPTRSQTAPPAVETPLPSTPPGMTPAPTEPAPTEPSPPTVAPARPKASAENPPPPRPIVAPADPIAAQAFAVLETHCARCHQGGRLKRAAPAVAFGNILRLDEIARDPVLVRPGNPDASRLYTHMLRRLMPFDVHQEQSGGAEPMAEELAAVRTWIARLEPVPACRDRRFVTAENHAAAMRDAAQAAGATAGRLRFISLAHLYNACATPEAMYGYRQAIVRLFNSVSWRPGPVHVEPVDDARTLLAFTLDELGWVPQHWEHILKSGPNGPGHLITLPKAATEPFGTDQPVARGDWLADTMLRSPLYYDLLGLPALSGEIIRILQLDPETLRRGGGSQRGGIKTSEFARAGRLIEHFGLRNRTLWTAYDAAPREGRRDLSETVGALTSPIPPHDAALSMFLLPNGLPGFFIADAKGDRIDQVPAEVARRGVTGRKPVRAGLDCLGCHAQGPAVVRNEAAAAGDLARSASRDRDSIREGLSSVAIDASYTIDGVEPIVALARQYTRPISAERAAVELGLEPSALAERLETGAGAMGVLGRRLLSGMIGRSDFEAEFRKLLTSVGAKLPETAPAAGMLPAADLPDPGPGLVLLSDKASYRSGEPLTLTVRTTADCHLSVISIDQRGRGTVIFPSDFEPNNLISSGRELKLPAESAPYVLRLKEKGRETIVAICNSASSTVDGIRHDFERQRFTDLGDYATFLAQAVTTEAGERRQPPSAQSAPPETKARGRRRGQLRPEPADTKLRPDQITHTAITIEVR